MTVLMLFAVLSVSAVSANWTNPTDGGDFSEPVNLTYENESATTGAVFYVMRPGNSNWEEIPDGPTATGDGVYYDNFGGSISSGDYRFIAEEQIDGGDDQNSSELQITIDTQPPEVSGESPMGYTNDDSPTVSFEADDNLGLDEDSYSVTVEGDGVDEQRDSDSVNLNNLDDGSYSVDYSVEDDVGNVEDGSWSFTVDTVYEGPESVDIEQDPGKYRVTGDNFVIPLRIDGSDTDESDIKIRCEMGDYSIESNWRNPDDSQYFECAPDTSNYQDVTLDLEVILEDRAGNSYTVESGDFTFDRTSPSLEDVSIPAETQNDDFEVSYSASDMAAGVENIHYQVDNSDLDLEEGVNRSHEGGSFSVSVEDLERGSHTLYVWSVDGVGRTSTVRSVDFSYDPTARPQVTLESSDVNVAAGERETVSVNVTNTGKVLVSGVEVQLSSAIFNSSRTIESLIPDESTTEAFTFETQESDLGFHPLNVRADPDGEATANITVTANQNQRESLDSRLEEWVDSRIDLGSNVTDLAPKLNDERESRLEDNFSDFNETLERAMDARESDRYWKVSDVLEGIEEEYSSAQESFRTVRQEYQVSRNQRNIVFALFMLVSLSGFGIGYAFFRDDVEIELEAVESAVEAGSVPAVSAATDPFVSAYESLLEMLEEEEEEMESGFQGFT